LFADLDVHEAFPSCVSRYLTANGLFIWLRHCA
jgi:hypothetical protein